MIFETGIDMKNFRPPPCAGFQTQSALGAQDTAIENVLPGAVGVPEIKLRC